MADNVVFPEQPTDIPMPPVEPTWGERANSNAEIIDWKTRAETAERMLRVDAALARQLSVAMIESNRLTNVLRSLTVQPHEREAMDQLIQTARVMAGMLRDNDPHAIKLEAWSNIVGQFLERNS